MPDRDYYADLGLTQYATGSQIRSAFHTLAKQHHPDKSGDVDASAFRVAREAYEKLSDATFKAEYDRNYCYMRMQSDTDGLTGTRTAAYEAEEAAREYDDDRATAAAYEEMLRRSPPPKKPARKFNESGASYFLGKAYTAWEKRDAAYRQKHPAYGQAQSSGSSFASSSAATVPKAHGLTVRMTHHPSSIQGCTLRTPEWRTQTSGSDFCVFCLKASVGGCRCPGCEALACKACLLQVIEMEQKSTFGTLRSKGQYRASGG